MALSAGPNQALARERVFQNQLAFGQIAETEIARWLLSRGRILLPIYDKEYDTGKGPRIFFKGGEFVAPDFLVFNESGKRIYWIEAKHKTRFTWHFISKRWTTGIDRHHYNQYRKVRDTLGFPVWLLFLHESSIPHERDLKQGCPSSCPTGLFGGDLDWMEANENHKHWNWGRTGMVYWAYRNEKEPDKNLKRIASLEKVRSALSVPCE